MGPVMSRQVRATLLSIVDYTPYVKIDLAAMIRQAQRLANHGLAAAEAAHALTHHTAAAKRHRAILRSPRELASKEGGQHGTQ